MAEPESFEKDQQTEIKESTDKEHNDIYENIEKQKQFFRDVDFCFDITRIPQGSWNFISKLKEKRNGESLNDVLGQNTQIQHLLGLMFSKYKKEHPDITEALGTNEGNDIKEGKNTDSEDNINVEQYLLKNGTAENFEEFLLSDQALTIIQKELKNYYNPRTGKLGSNSVSYNDIADYIFQTLKDKFNDNLTYDFNIQNYQGGIDEEEDRIIQINNGIVNDIDNIVSDYLKNDKYETNFYTEIKAIASKLSEDNILNDENHKKLLKWELSKEIRKLESFAQKDTNSVIFRNKIVRNKIKAYSFLILYIDDPKISFSDGDFEAKSMKKVRNLYKTLEELKREKDIEALKEREEQERLAKRREARILERKRIAEHNKKLSDIQQGDLDPNLRKGNDDNNFDLQNASGFEIAKQEGLGEKLYQKDTHLSEELSNKLKHDAFNEVFHNDYASKLEIRIEDIEFTLFDFDNFSIKENEWDVFCHREFVLQDKTEVELNNIKSALISFANSVKNQYEKLEASKLKEGNKKEIIKNEQAAGIIIDQVKNIFSDIDEKSYLANTLQGFIFDQNEPVIIDNSNMLITGTFNNTNILLRYNLNSGELFTNSFIGNSKGENGGLIINNTNTDYKLGTITPFNNILDEVAETMPVAPAIPESPRDVINKPSMDNISHQQHPKDIPPKHFMDSAHHQPHIEHGISQHQTGYGNFSQPPIDIPSKFRRPNIDFIKEKSGNNIDAIPLILQQHIESESIKSDTINSFFKTFNLYEGWNTTTNMEFLQGSKYGVFDMIQVFKNSDPKCFKKFKENMNTILAYSGLKRGESNYIQNKDSELSQKVIGAKVNPDSSIESNNLSFFKDMMFNSNNNINDNHLKYSGSLGIIQLTIEKFTDGTPPMQTLNIWKMKEFIQSYKNCLDYTDTSQQKIQRYEEQEKNDADKLLESL